MYTILKCNQCRTVKLITDRLPGETVPCPGCKNIVEAILPRELGRAIIQCGHCGARGIIPQSKIGITVTCPRCKQEIQTRSAILDAVQKSEPAGVALPSAAAGENRPSPPSSPSPEDRPPATETSVKRAAAKTPEAEEERPDAGIRRQGTILRFFLRYGKPKRYGLIQSGQEQIWFHLNHFREKTTRSMLPEGTPVSFVVRASKTHPDKFEADDIVILQQPAGRAAKPPEPELTRSKSPLYEWAYMPNEEGAYEVLAKLALPEDWGNNWGDQNGYPYPILRRYIHNTFVRLQHEGKIIEITANTSRPLAAFNTGLVDRRYESIFALFEPNRIAEQTGTRWCFKSFCIAGEKDGKDLSRFFNPLPEPPNYCTVPALLFYDSNAGFPHIDYDHILLDNIDRLPLQFLEQCCGLGTIARCRTGDTVDADSLRRMIEDNSDILNIMKRRLKSEVELAIKKTRTNFRVAVPQYNTKFHRMELLLPLSLVTPGTPDMALVVEKTGAGHYLAHTILSLDWAYSNARLVSRLDENWLNIEKLREIYR